MLSQIIVLKREHVFSVGETCFVFCEVISIDLRIPRRLHGLLRQWAGRGAAAVLHGNRNPQRRMGADARSSHRRIREMDAAWGGQYPARSCTRRHDAADESGDAAVPDADLRRGDLHRDHPARSAAPALGHGDELQDPRSVQKRHRGHRGQQTFFFVVRGHVPRWAAWVHVRRVPDPCANGAAEHTGGRRLSKSGDRAAAAARPALPHLPRRTGAKQSHGLRPPHLLRPPGQHDTKD